MPPSLMRITNYPHYCSTIYCGPSGTQRGFAISCPPFGPPLGRSPPASLSLAVKGAKPTYTFRCWTQRGSAPKGTSRAAPEGAKGISVLRCSLVPFGQSAIYAPPSGAPLGFQTEKWAIYYVPLLCPSLSKGPRGAGNILRPKGFRCSLPA